MHQKPFSEGRLHYLHLPHKARLCLAGVEPGKQSSGWAGPGWALPLRPRLAVAVGVTVGRVPATAPAAADVPLGSGRGSCLREPPLETPPTGDLFLDQTRLFGLPARQSFPFLSRHAGLSLGNAEKMFCCPVSKSAFSRQLLQACK